MRDKINHVWVWGEQKFESIEPTKSSEAKLPEVLLEEIYSKQENMSVAGCIGVRTRRKLNCRRAFNDVDNAKELKFSGEVSSKKWDKKNREFKWRGALRTKQIYKVSSGESGKLRRQRRDKLRLKGRMVGAMGIYASSHCAAVGGSPSNDVMAYETVPDWWREGSDEMDTFWTGTTVVVNCYSYGWRCRERKYFYCTQK